MAQRVDIVLLDDLDGGDAAETVVFGLDGSEYEIDLSEKHADSLRKALAKYVDAGRRIKQGKKKGRGSSNGLPGQADAKTIRAWAREAGYEIPDRGRVPQEIREKYAANAH